MNGKKNFRSLILLFMLVALTACGGGGGPVEAEFTKTYGPSDFGQSSLLFHETLDAKIQFLYTAAKVSGSGNLTSLRFRRDLDGGQVNCPNTTVRLGHTSSVALTTTFGSNVENGKGSLVTVIDNTTLSIPAGSAGEWFEIPLSNSFAYNGVDNLVVEIERLTVCTAKVRIDLYGAEPAGSVAYASAIDTTSGVADHNQTTADSLGTYLVFIQFVFAGGDNKMDYAAVSAGTVPFANSSNERHGQMLHQAGSINGSGPITGIAMMSNVDSAAQTYTVNIKLGHTTLSALTDTFADNFDSASPTEVATALTFTIPAGIPAGSPIWIPLTSSFNYNGIDNLIVDIEVIAATGTIAWARDGAASHRLYAAVGDTVGTLTDGSSHTVFRFRGGTMDVGLPGDASVNLVFDDSVDGAVIQNLYRPVDLGTGGLIDSIGVRLVNDSLVAVHSDYTVRMGHTAKTALSSGDTFASNMDEDLTVYSGSFSIPAGLKAGDWVSIPLSTGFNYDATKNLVILFSTLGGAASANDVQLTGGQRYSSSVSGSGVGSDPNPTFGTEDAVVATQLHIQK